MKEELLELLADIRPEFDFSESTNFIEEGMLDSFDIVSLVTAIDDKYQVAIDGVDIIPENFSNLESIESLINKSK